MRPLVMGIVNVTPDSFSDGGRFTDPESAIVHGLELVAQGADIVDVGGESSRPGAELVDAHQERDRVLPVIEALALHVRVSVDTAKATVAHAAIDAGATLVNDITASLDAVAAERQVGWVAMHMQGVPRTMHLDPQYDDVVAEVTAFLCNSAARARAAGVEEIWIDPGIGFGKAAHHNWALLGALGEIVASGWPVTVGTSRKAFLGAVLAGADGSDGQVGAHDRLEASVATATWSAMQGVGMVRVHDVGATVAALDAITEIEAAA